MPALVLFGRQWLFASDDLFIPFMTETVLRTTLAFTTSYMLWIHFQHQDDSNSWNDVMAFLVLLLADFLLNVGLCASLTILSGRGSVMQVEKRSLVPKILYTKVISFLLDLFLTVAAVYLAFFKSEEYNLQPEIDIYMMVLVASSLVYFAIVAVCVILSYTTLGSPKYWNTPENVNSPEFYGKFVEKAKKTWYKRVKCTLCFLGFSPKKNKSAIKEVASFLTNIFSNAELVPTDVLAGLIVLSRKHASERRRLKFMDSLCSHAYICADGDYHPEWMTVENALYFLRLAKTAYGWPILFNNCNPFSISSETGCFGFLGDDMGSDKCYNCNIAALRKSTGYPDEDFIYASYANSVCEPAFYVVIDKSKSSIIIVIRGTFDFSDVVTLLIGDLEMVHVSGQDVYCHKGLLQSALYIRKKLMDLHVLKIASAEYPRFSLVTVGHSLGAAVSSILGLLLREDYPNVQSFCFSPLPCLSLTGTRMSSDFIMSVVIGDDIVPRISQNACESLRKEIIKSLEECNMQKYKLMLNAATKILFKRKLFHHQCFPKNINSLRQNSVASAQVSVSDDSTGDNDMRLYAPGRILYLEQTFDGVKAFWKTGFHFHRIIISPNMLVDHQPRRMQEYLEQLWCKSAPSPPAEESDAAATNLAYCPSPELDRKSTICSSSLNESL